MIKQRKDGSKSMAASSFVDHITICVFAHRNSVCTSRRLFPRLYLDWSLAIPEASQKCFLAKEHFRMTDKKLGLSTLTRFHVSVFLWAKTWQDISARTDVFAASSLIHIKTVENDKIRWTWNSAYVRAVTAVNFFHHPS